MPARCTFTEKCVRFVQKYELEHDERYLFKHSIARSIEPIGKIGGIRVGETEVTAWVRSGGSHVDPVGEIRGRLDGVDGRARACAGQVQDAACKTATRELRTAQRVADKNYIVSPCPGVVDSEKLRAHR